MYPGYDADKSKMEAQKKLRWVYAGLGVLFAGMVVNPNYTSKNSFYLRKLYVFLFGYTGFVLGQKYLQNQATLILARQHEFMPREVQSALKTKDYRYLALFDWNNPTRQLFDETTGKAI